MKPITYQEFLNYKQQGYNLVPVVKELLADLDTPISVYLKIANQPYTYLYESVHGGEKWGRYSFIGLPCATIIKVLASTIILTENDKVIEKFNCEDPLQWIEEYLKRFKIPEIINMPRFNGGLVGYFGYDTIRYIEPRLRDCSLPDPLQTPDIWLMVSKQFVVFDNLYQQVFLISYVNPQQSDAWEQANHQLNQLALRLQQSLFPMSGPDKKKQEEDRSHHDIQQSLSTNHLVPGTQFAANMSKQEYIEGVKKAINYFIDGDAMQMTFSQRFSKPFYQPAINFYRALRHVNPSPYLFFLNCGEFYIAGASPEILVRLEDNNVTIRPLAGTRPRGATQQEDAQQEHELLTNPKERAEHLMLIDLARNDVGRISKIGTVKVTEAMGVEYYSHVMHIVSNVVGELKPELTAMDVLRACFPAGTVSGTPKIRAMEMIDELENVKRGIYAGAVGYLSWNGNMDIAITLRTAVIKNNILYVQAGGGLVVNSDPQAEWQESVNKAKAVFHAAELAEQLKSY